jgi:hypothetical protein
MKTLSLKLPDSVATRLALAAKRSKQSKSAIIRAMLEERLSEGNGAAKGSCLELASDLAGCVAGPKDLSTNKKHMQGYGQ